MPPLDRSPSVLSVLSSIPKFDLSPSPVLLRSSQMATQDITTDKITSGKLSSLDEKQQLSDVVLNSVDDQLNHEIEPKEERAFV
jgi:hypothetical protein